MDRKNVLLYIHWILFVVVSISYSILIFTNINSGIFEIFHGIYNIGFYSVLISSLLLLFFPSIKFKYKIMPWIIFFAITGVFVLFDYLQILDVFYEHLFVIFFIPIVIVIYSILNLIIYSIYKYYNKNE